MQSDEKVKKWRRFFNGRGGGDFRGNSDLIGTWARDVISVEAELPVGYVEINFDLV